MIPAIAKVFKMPETKIYPIAQLFTSPQGEGLHSGVLMRFVRLAGCNVGVYSVGANEQLAALRVLHPKHSICTSALGDSFLCDTNYFSIAKMSAEDAIQSEVPGVTAVCLTGGEPFMHDVMPFVKATQDMGQSLHIETSGTKPIPQAVAEKSWITCSPKSGFLKENLGHIDEMKFLVPADDSDLAEMLEKIYACVGGDTGPSLMPCFLSPINGIDTIDPKATARALALQRLDPRLVITIQQHKVLGCE